MGKNHALLEFRTNNDMNEITLNLNVEQVALLNKLLEPYVTLYSTINNQYMSRQSQQAVPAQKVTTDKSKE